MMHRHTFRTAMAGSRSSPLEAVARAEAVGWKARADAKPVALPQTPDDWTQDPLSDRNWRFQLHSWRPLDDYIVAHDVTGDPAMLERAVRMIATWREAESRANDDALFWNDMGTGLRAAKLAYMISRLSSLPPQMREIIIALGRSHLRRLRVEAFYSMSNHGLFQVYGLTALSDVMPAAPEAEGGKAFAEQMLERILASQFGQEGVHLEHSPGYHYFVILTLRKMMATGWYDAMPQVAAIIDLAKTTFPWFVFPDGRISGAGDSDRNVPRFTPPNIKSVKAALFQEAGYAVVRTDWAMKGEWRSMLLVTAGHHSHVHKHADDLSFEFYDKGRFWIVDTGKYSYSKRDWREYTDSARAHNSVDLTPLRSDNGLGVAKPRGGALTRADREGLGWVVEGLIDRPEIGARHSRRFYYVRRKSLTIEDHIQLADHREVTAWLHLAPDLHAERSEDGWRFEGGSIAYGVSGASLDLVRVRAQTEPVIQGWMAESYHRIVANDALGARLVGQDIKLTTTITLD